ncbi:MAG: hypothetical protein H0W68_11675 [Gemmatimonadaceae bacterium]|nr:hypothetical protein [Gemmatimonadaceae bacterium]
MQRARRCIAALAVAAGLLLPHALVAQTTVALEVPTITPFPAAPQIVVRAVGFPAGSGPRSVRLRLSLTPNFGLIVFDSVIAGDLGVFRQRRLLPENSEIYAEATVLDAIGRVMLSSTQRAGRTGTRLELIGPSGKSGVTLNTRQPVFAWRSASVTAPPGPWVYELFITNVATQETRSRISILDTIYTYPDTLQANTSYRWRVVARLQNGSPADSAVASSLSSFVIAPSDAPLTTLLYQNFPNPFPAASSQTTCVWFDLERASIVRLQVLDLRGHLVRKLIPAVLTDDLPSGRYGRLIEGAAGGCDQRLAWDGTGDDGRVAAPGIYLLMLHADGRKFSRKIVFLGR